MSFLSKGVVWLDAKRKTYLTETVTYSRGADSVVISATFGYTSYELADEGGLLIRSRTTDFIVTRADLVLSGALIEPELGDQIRYVNGAETFVYEVLDLGGEGVFRPSGLFDIAYRIHARRVDTE